LQTPAGGGVSIVADEALAPAHLRHDKDGKLNQRRREIRKPPAGDAWWWD
jgi:hypothetical protein